LRRTAAGAGGAVPVGRPGAPAAVQTVEFMKKVQFAHNRQITVIVTSAESLTFNQPVQKSKHVFVK
jgi:hypothetical protein